MPIGLTIAWVTCLSSLQSRPVSEPTENAEADAILDQSIAARGGRDAFAALSHRYCEGTSKSDDGSRVSDRFLVERRGRYWYEGNHSEYGKVRSGSDGTTYWTCDSLGCTIYDGERRDYKMAESAFDILVDYEQFFPRRRLVGVAEVGADTCDIIRLTSRANRDEDWYVDRKSRLVRRVKRQWIANRNRIDVVCDYLDYRSVDGVLVPHTLLQRSSTPNGAFQMRTEYTIVSHKQNKPDEKEFVLPDEVQALLHQRVPSKPVSTSNPADSSKTP